MPFTSAELKVYYEELQDAGIHITASQAGRIFRTGDLPDLVGILLDYTVKIRGYEETIERLNTDIRRLERTLLGGKAGTDRLLRDRGSLIEEIDVTEYTIRHLKRDIERLDRLRVYEQYLTTSYRWIIGEAEAADRAHEAVIKAFMADPFVGHQELKAEIEALHARWWIMERGTPAFKAVKARWAELTAELEALTSTVVDLPACEPCEFFEGMRVQYLGWLKDTHDEIVGLEVSVAWLDSAEQSLIFQKMELIRIDAQIKTWGRQGEYTIVELEKMYADRFHARDVLSAYVGAYEDTMDRWGV